MLYILVLHLLKSIIVLYKILRVYVLQFYYFSYLNYEKLLKYLNIDNIYDGWKSQKSKNFLTKCSNQNNDILLSFTPPTHVCVILNEDIQNYEDIYSTFSFIVDYLANIGVDMITFYKFNGF